MVIQNIQDSIPGLQKTGFKIKDMEKEISILHALGIEDYEIEYLIHLKIRGSKFENSPTL